MPTSPRFIMIGGFLGAGKTTTISGLAMRFRQAGQNVAIVTNDQASDLVDTLLLRSQGFHVGEVAGSCFCCNFDALTDTVESLANDERPDVVLAEPVGSCTDLVATVIRPLEKIYSQPFDIAPYGVIIKPSHGEKILGDGVQRGFSPKAAYIFRKQIEEADFVILNRIDELSGERVTRLTKLLSEQFPDTPVVPLSAKSGMGFERLEAVLNQRDIQGRRSMDVDYEVYAEGEAELGWLNCQGSLQSSGEVPVDDFLLDLVSQLQQDFIRENVEIAHLKVIGLAEGVYAVANVVSNVDQPQLSLPAQWQGSHFELVVNARVATSPEQLESLVRKGLESQAERYSARVSIQGLQCFRPGKPVPTHRLLT
ncbi:MAG: cobalamin biosynthesis protein P47K [Planctomycetales bacterium]|nr:cobalamin biosynthesis protein P47K [Planctomycetales bacterium]